MTLPMHRLAVPDPHAMPFAAGSFDAIGPMSRADFPHRHTFYEIVLVTGCEGRHIVDFTEHLLRPPQLYVIAPGQVHYWRVSRLDGYVILFLEDFLTAYPADRDLLHALAERRLTPRPAAARRLRATVTALIHEYAHLAAGSLGVLQAYVHVLLVQAWRLDAGTELAQNSTAAVEVARRFRRMLAEPAGHLRPPQHYAARLGVSTGYLSDAVRQAAGLTPAQLIRRARIVEAKRLLSATPMTVAQISGEVGFGDPAYFSRFFRRETGLSPGDFRRGGHV